jgi:hypothetical protein
MRKRVQSLSGSSLDSMYHIMVSIDVWKVILYLRFINPRLSFGTGFTSENVELETEIITLQIPVIILRNSDISSPIEGSPLAYLVNDPCR